MRIAVVSAQPVVGFVVDDRVYEELAVVDQKPANRLLALQQMRCGDVAVVAVKAFRAASEKPGQQDQRRP